MRKVICLGMTAVLMLSCAAQKASVTSEAAVAVGFAGFTSSMIAEQELASYSASFIDALNASGKFTVVDRKKFTAALAAGKAKAGKALNIRIMISGSISSLGAEYYLLVESLDMETGSVERSLREKVTGGMKNIDAAFQRIIQRL